METINNVASAASKAIWGDSTTTETGEKTDYSQEPVSGRLGNTAAGEPYDAGNIEDYNTDLASPLDPTTGKELFKQDEGAAVEKNEILAEPETKSTIPDSVPQTSVIESNPKSAGIPEDIAAENQDKSDNAASNVKAAPDTAGAISVPTDKLKAESEDDVDAANGATDEKSGRFGFRQKLKAKLRRNK